MHSQLDADFLRHVLANAPIVIFAFDTEGRLTFSDGRGLELLGLHPGQNLGTSVFEMWPGTPLAEMCRRALAGETCRSHSRAAEQGRAYETTYGPLLDERGRIIGGIGVSVDVTEHLQVERAQAESDAKTRFLAGMSHELRTPLNSILGFAQLLQQPTYGDLTARQQHYVENIISSGRHLLSLVNDVLDISKVKAGRLDLHCERLDLATLVRDVVTEVEPLAAPKQLRLRVDSIALAAVGDARATRQILLNLLSNAIKFTPSRRRVTVALRRMARGDAAITVTDCGPGIPRERRREVFEEFTHVTLPPSGPPGTGLGLCLSRHLARAMGGDVTLASRVGRGSTFTLRLPSA
ncbi:MAG TPA: ATP-binding protein [Candidatus Dormibacteraeota bacterium]